MEDQGFAAVGLPVALAIIMVGIGLTLTTNQFTKSLSSRGVIAAGVIGQLLFVPIVGLAVAFALQMEPVFAIGLMLVAATPGGVTTNLFTHLCKGNVPLSIILTVLASIAMMVTLPFWIWLSGKLFPVTDHELGFISVPPGPVIGMLLGVVALPIALGMFIRAKNENLAKKLEKIVSVVGVITIVIMFVFLVIDLKDQLGDILVKTGPAVVIFTGLIMALGWGLAVLVKRPIEDRVALAVEFALRNSTMSLVIALTVIQDSEVAAPAAVFSVVMYIYGGALAFARRKAQRPTEVNTRGVGIEEDKEKALIAE
ncbi:bile acid:sodium symporter family protein [Corynebacterium urogenitale]